MSLKALFFDFDGVVLDSLKVKTDAFYNMYLPYGKHIADQVARHHLKYGGVSRFEKFKIYHRDFLQQELNENEILELAEEYSKRVKDRVIKSPEVNGVRSFFENNYTKYQIFIITGTPTSEIHEIIRAINMEHFFKGIYGSPETKDYWVKKIISDFNLNPDEILFIGDATTDRDAALGNGLHFILREHEDNMRFFEGEELVRILDFRGFDELISYY